MEKIVNNLKQNYKTTNVFRGIDTEVIKEELNITLNNRKLNKVIKEAFEDVKVRGDGFNKKYFLEHI